MALDINSIRKEFPILKQTIYGKPLVYLDNGATTQKPQVVINAISDIYCNINSNIHRGVHHLSNVCTLKYEEARQTVCNFINAKNTYEVVFTRGTTESINLVAFSFGETFCKKDDEIIISAMEHHANIVPWQMLCMRKGMKLRVAPINENGELQTEQLYSLINEHTRLIAVTQVSNVMGTVNPVADIIKVAHSHNIPVLVDAAQSAPHMNIDVQKLDCDFLAFSGHKMYGPNGIGVLYGKEKWLNQMVPYQGGGEMIEKVTFEKTTYNALPLKFEAGTPDYVGAIVLGKAIEFIKSIGQLDIEAHEQMLVKYAMNGLSTIEGLRFIGNAKNHSGAVSFVIDGMHPLDIGMILDKMGIAVRTGHHCAEPLIDHFGITGTVRASLAMYNTTEEIDSLINGVKRVVTMLK